MKPISKRDPTPRKKTPEILIHIVEDDGIFPNSPLPLIVYRHAINPEADDCAADFEKLFATNSWEDSWRNGIYPYHHYHSTAHEVLGVYCGSVRVRLGGEKGITQELKSGDALIIPAGVAHKNLDASPDFAVVGAYPRGQKWDMNYGRPSERASADANIQRVRLPELDPVFGKEGPLLKAWVQ